MIPTLTKEDLIEYIPTLDLENPEDTEALFNSFDFNKNTPAIVFDRNSSTEHAGFENENDQFLFEDFLGEFFIENDADAIIVINSLDDIRGL